MKRTLKIAGGIIAALVAIVVIALVILSTVNLNRARPWIDEKVSAATGRSFAINGDLSLSWERPGQEKGWRRLVPWPHFRARDVVLGNPDWATTGPEMARIAQIDFSINPFKLLTKTVSVQSLIMTEPRLVLEQDRKSRKNWDFPKSESKSNWSFEIKSVAMTAGTLRYVDALKRADMTARVDTEPDNSMRWQLAGTFNDEKITGSAHSGALLSLQEKGVAYPIEAKVEVGETTITAEGTLTDPANPSALDVRLSILGASMADLFPLGGVLLPRTPKFSTEGRVVGTLGRNNLRLRYENFKGRVGGSDIGGTLEYVQQDPRPILRGDVVSNKLVWKDLGAVVGAGDEPKKQKSGEVKQPPGKVLPVSPFNTDRWGKMDADVKFSGKQIIHSDKLPLDNLDTHITMSNGALSLSPLNFGVAGGRLATELKIDGSNSPAKANMKVSARGLRLRELFPKVESMHASLGQINGDAKLSAAGNSFAALAAGANGEVKALINEGTVSEFIMEAMGLNAGRVVVNKLFGDKQVKLNCLAADLDIKQGLVQPQIFILDTADAIVEVDGNVSLAKETLDLDIRPRSKGLRLFSLRSPLYVKGTFKKPDVGVNKSVIALRAGAAVALGAIAVPLAGLAALTQPGPDHDSPCNSLLAEARKAPVAPPAGQSAKGSSHEKAVPWLTKPQSSCHNIDAAQKLLGTAKQFRHGAVPWLPAPRRLVSARADNDPTEAGATAGKQPRTGIHLLACKGIARDQQVHAERLHQKFLHASLLEKLQFVHRTPSVFMTWLLFSLAVALIGWGVLLANLKEAQRTVQARALTEASALARTHADRLARSLDAMDQVSRHVRLEWQLADGALDLHKLRQDGLFTAPSLYDVTLFNRDGVPVTSTSPTIWAAPVQDRDYFIALRDATADPLSVSTSASGTTEPRDVLNIARRLNDDSGNFAGVVLVSVTNEFFTVNYDPTVLGAHGLMGMLSYDHTVEVLRVGERLLAPEQHAFSAAPHLSGPNGSTRVAAQAFDDRRPRFLGWHAVPNHPMLALIGLDEADTLAQYYAGRHSAIWYATWATAALAVLTVLAIVLSAELAWRKHRLGMAQATYRLATEEGSEGFYIVRPVRDRQGTVLDFTVLDCNQQGAEFFNVRPQELIGRSVSAFRGNMDTGMFIDYLLQATENGVYENEIDVPGNAALRLRWAHLKIIRSGENLAVRLRDISEAKAHVAELKRRGNEDMLTGLPNRHWIQGFLPEALQRAQQENEHLALLFIDLDNFKKVNDTAGHAAGDELLKHAAQRLQEAVRPHDKVVRFGGDEFVVIIEDIEHRMDAAHVAERIGVAFRQSFRLSQGVHLVGTSIGIAMFPTDGADAQTLLEKADIAMYSVKTRGKSGYQFYEAKFYHALRDRLDREAELRRAIARDEFLMMYQPRVDILSGLTLSMEALVRWRHPARGLLEPAEFIPMAEETGMIVELGALVIEKVCAQIARWSESGDTLVPVSINVSPQQFSNADVGSMLAATLARHKVAPELIELEITESSVMDQDAAVSRTLSLLQKQGIKILVDDFGTGYSSLSQLHRLDFDVLKVDQAFTANIETSAEGMVFFTAIITMAHALGMRVVAEGVENLAQVRLLRTLECDEVQGYYISRPLPAGDSQPVLPPQTFPTAYGNA